MVCIHNVKDLLPEVWFPLGKRNLQEVLSFHWLQLKTQFLWEWHLVYWQSHYFEHPCTYYWQHTCPYILHGSRSLLRSLARVQCPMSSRHSIRVPQVTGCRPSPPSHLCRMVQHACSTWKWWFCCAALIIPTWNRRARESFSQSAQTSSITLTCLPLIPTNVCSCHISGLSPTRRDTGKHSLVSGNRPAANAC